MQRSQTERLWLVGGSIVALVALLIGWFFFISPQRADTDNVNTQAASARADNASLEQRIATLRNENRNLPKYQAELAAAQLALPGTSGLSDFLRTLQSIGNATLTDISSLDVGAPTDVTTVASSNGSAAPSAAPTAAPTSAPAGAAGASSTGPKSGAIYALAITAQATGSPAALNRFLAQLQSVQPRAVLIGQIVENSGEVGGTARGPSTTSMQVTMQAFVAPVSAAESAQLAAASHK